MQNTTPTDRPFEPRWALALLLALAVFFVWATWGHVDYFFGDYALWLEQAHRSARGEVLYRDFYWPFPPLALWMMGTLLSVLGVSLPTVGFIVAGVFLLIATAFFCYATRIVPRAYRVLTLLAGLVLAVGFSFQASAPVSVGLYSPAAPIGFLLLLISINAALGLSPLRQAPANDVWRAVVVGICCSLAVLTKQDFWVPAAYLSAGTAWLLWRERSVAAAGAVMAATVITFGAGVAPIVSELGWSSLLQIATGYGMLHEVGGFALPWWERIVAQVAQTGLIVLLVLGCLVAAGAVVLKQARAVLIALVVMAALAAGLHFWRTTAIVEQARTEGPMPQARPTADFASGQPNASVRQVAVLWLYRRLQNYFIPVFVPMLLLLAVGWRWKALDPSARTKLLFLVGLCITARARRALQMVEWFHVLLELPVYILALQILFPLAEKGSLQRAIRLLLVLLLVYGSFNYWRLGMGAFTRRGVLPVTDTPRGPARFGPMWTRVYGEVRRAVEELDPEGKRPLLTQGYTDGLNFFLDRRNPTALTQGFRLSRFSPEELSAQVAALSPPPILVDSRMFSEAAAPVAQLNLRVWEPQMKPAHYETFDRPWFEKLLARCTRFRTVQVGDAPFFVVYDCPAQTP